MSLAVQAVSPVVRLVFLTGLRSSDFSALRPEDLQHDMVYKREKGRKVLLLK